MKPILLSISGNPENQDRGLVIHDGVRTVLCVADGAGGTGGGAEAAVIAIELVSQRSGLLKDAQACVDLLLAMDAAVARDPIAGETTCVLAVMSPSGVFGASVGDSGAWIFSDTGKRLDLTVSQQRKPFIGSGTAWPVAFTHRKELGVFLLATDGLLKYTSPERIEGVCRKQPLDSAAQRLVELVRYPSGALPDDVTIIMASLLNP